VGFIYVASSDVAVANTTTETTLFPSTLTIPADTVVAGTSFRLTISGSYTTTLVPPTLRVRIKLGSVVVVDTGAVTSPIANAAAHFFDIQGIVEFRSIGASGTAKAEGRVFFAEDSSLVPKVFEFPPAFAASINTTVDQVLSVTAQWGTASLSNSITEKTLIVELIPSTA
jgi:hypothetical protein